MSTFTPRNATVLSIIGSTDGGPPTEGSFVAGNCVMDNDQIWACIQGGTPGTWTAFGGVSPGTAVGGTGTGVNLYSGTGAPDDDLGTEGDLYVRSDGGTLTTVYQYRTDAWVGVV